MSVCVSQQVITVLSTADLVPCLVYIFSYCLHFSIYKMASENIKSVLI